MKQASRLTGLLILLVLAASLIPSLMAQSDETVITIGINEWQQNIYNDELFDEFEAENPGVKVVPVIMGRNSRMYERPSLEDPESIDRYIETTMDYASSADVLPTDSIRLDYYGTRAGAFLNIEPFIEGDTRNNIEDFYPAMLDMYRWDGGVWGLPISGALEVLLYDKNAFDAANMPYPDSSWTLADYAEASLELARRDENGNITMPGMISFNPAAFMRAQLGHGLMNDSTPAMPDFSDPELVEMIQTWRDYIQTLEESRADEQSMGGNPYEAAISLTGLEFLRFEPPTEEGAAEKDWQVAYLPGEQSSLRGFGYAVSAGSDNPQLAYELMQFLSRRPDVTSQYPGSATARRTIQGVLPDDMEFTPPPMSDEFRQIQEEALENAIPASEMFFFNDLLNRTMYSIPMDEELNAEDIQSNIQTFEDEVEQILLQIEEQSDTTVVAVQQPEPTPVLAADEIAIRFAYDPSFGWLERDVWDEKAAEFVAQDARVGQVQLSSNMAVRDPAELFEQQDCLMFGQNIADFMEPGLLLPLDPFLAADPQFNEEAIAGNILQQVQTDGMTLVLPLAINPIVMQYNDDAFDRNNVPVPATDWDISTFERTLRDLKAGMDGDQAPYQTHMQGNNIILRMLAVSYGAQNLIDTSTSPPTFNLTDETNLAALRDVLDLAKEGYMGYEQQVVSMSGGGGGRMFSSAMGVPLMDTTLNFYGPDAQTQNYASFPVGSGSIPASYQMSVAVISAQSPQPDACYRWLSYLTQQPEFINGIPANRNMLQNEGVAARFGGDFIAFSQEYLTLLDNPNVEEISYGFGVGDSFNEFFIYQAGETWLNRAMDRYVLEDASLEDELASAEQYIQDTYQCAAGLPEISLRGTTDMEPEEIENVREQLLTCIESADPTIMEFFQ